MLLYFNELLQGDANLSENKKGTLEDSNLVIDMMIAASIYIGILILVIVIIVIFKWTKNLKYKTLPGAEDPDHKSDIMKSFKVGNERLHLVNVKN